MRRWLLRVACVIACSIPAAADAATILVADVEWDVHLAFGCDPAADLDNPDCTTSFFVLTNDWDGPPPVPDITNASVTIDAGLPSVMTLPWPSLVNGLGDNVQVFAGGIPTSAHATIQFLFNGVLRTLTADLLRTDLVLTCDPPDGCDPFSSARTTFQFEAPAAVPEPASPVVVGLGLLFGTRRRR